MSIQVSVTAAHIASAEPYPSKSPIALALREMGYADATVGRSYACMNTKVYALPEAAIASERCFDFLAKGGALQGEVSENIFPYTFEMKELKQDDI